MKKAISILLTAALLLSLIPFMILTASADIWLEYQYKVLENGTAEISGFKLMGLGDYDYYNIYGEDVYIPSKIDQYTVTSIGDYAFSGCVLFGHAYIPDTVTHIGNYAFCGCDLMMYVDIPDSVTSIGDYAFESCGFLREVTIPASVTSIGAAPFKCCYELDHVEIDSDNPAYCLVGGNLYDIGMSTLIESLSGGSFSIPDTVRRIGASAFSYGGTPNSRTLTIPNTVVSIGEFAFCGTQMYSVILPDSVTSISDGMFQNCKYLKSVKLGNRVTEIGDWAFGWCSELTSISIPSTVRRIGKGAFNECTKLAHVKKDTSIAGTGAEMSDDYLSSTGEVPDSSDAYIGESAFKKCRSLAFVDIPESVTDIGDEAFNGCSSLESITIPGSVTSIGTKAFVDCSRMRRLDIPASVTHIGNTAFGYYYLDYSSSPQNYGYHQVDTFYVVGSSGSVAMDYAKDNDFSFIDHDSIKPGDADDDGEITLMDVTDIQYYLSSMKTNVNNDEKLMSADVDKNGWLEVIDATFIQRYVAELDIPYDIG